MRRLKGESEALGYSALNTVLLAKEKIGTTHPLRYWVCFQVVCSQEVEVALVTSLFFHQIQSYHLSSSVLSFGTPMCFQSVMEPF